MYDYLPCKCKRIVQCMYCIVLHRPLGLVILHLNAPGEMTLGELLLSPYVKLT